MARYCEKHMKKAVDTWVSRKDHSENDLCEICLEEVREILTEKPKEAKRGRKKV
jgi:hypothetical protein